MIALHDFVVKESHSQVRIPDLAFVLPGPRREPACSGELVLRGDALESGGVELDFPTCSQRCGLDAACASDSDCVTSKCDSGTSLCRALTAREEAAISCANGVQDNVETATDWGGSPSE